MSMIEAPVVGPSVGAVVGADGTSATRISSDVKL